jgi:hypothetical protein
LRTLTRNRNRNGNREDQGARHLFLLPPGGGKGALFLFPFLVIG